MAQMFERIARANSAVGILHCAFLPMFIDPISVILALGAGLGFLANHFYWSGL